MSIKIGQGFSYVSKSGVVYYGLIVDVIDTNIGWIPVIRAYHNGNRVVCYDDFNAEKDKHANNVRLDSCPPPFSVFGTQHNFKNQKIGNSVAVADMGKVRYVPSAIFDTKCVVLDRGQQVSSADMERVFNHPWQSRRQKEKLLSDMSELNLDDKHQSFDLI